MTNAKRGRPIGSSSWRERDEQTMTRMADLISADPNLSATDAMRQTGIDGDTNHRRLRRKWKQHSARHLEASRKRLADRRSEPVSTGGTSYRSPFDGFGYGVSGGMSLAMLAAHSSSLGMQPSALERATEAMNRQLRMQEIVDRQIRRDEAVAKQIRQMDQWHQITRHIAEQDRMNRLIHSDRLLALGLTGPYGYR